jgi:hypothetical protein
MRVERRRDAPGDVAPPVGNAAAKARVDRRTVATNPARGGAPRLQNSNLEALKQAWSE